MAVLLLAACSDGKEPLEISNVGTTRATVQLGDDPPEELRPDAGIVLVEGGCAELPIIVRFDDGTVNTIARPACAGSRVLIKDGTWQILPAVPDEP